MALLKKALEGALSLLPSDHRTILRPETLAAGFTQSEIGTWDQCAEKWYLGYNHLLRMKGTFEWYFVYGDGVHDTLSRWYTNGDERVAILQVPADVILTAEQEFELQKWQAILGVQMEHYFRYYKDDLETWTPWANEEIVEVEFEGIRLTGKVDLGFSIDGEAGDICADHKTYGMDDTAGWEFRFQFMFYLWLIRQATGRNVQKFLVNGIKKPALKLGKAESIETFTDRVRQNMIQEPEKYFNRQPLHAIKDAMENFEERSLRPKIERIKAAFGLTQAPVSGMLLESLVRNQNSHHCVSYGKVCQFMPICKHGHQREAFRYVRRADKHQELAE